MSLSFSGSYSPAVSLALTWSEQFQLFQDEDQTIPQDITGLHIRAQLRPDVPTTPADDPVLEITTPDFYASPAAYVREAFTVDDAANGEFSMELFRADYVSVVSPTNEKVKYYWEVVLVNTTTGDVEPVVKGRVIFLPAVTI